MMQKLTRILLAAILVCGIVGGAAMPAAAADHTHTPANVVRTQDAAVEGVDLIVTDIAWTGDPDHDAQVKPGTAMTFTVTVKNQGSQATPAGYDTAVDIAVNAQTIKTVSTPDVIQAGESRTFTTSEPWTPAAGDYFIVALVRNANTRAELDARNDNNDYMENLRVADDVLTAPAAALKRGYNKLTYCDDFNSLNTIDVKATGAEGYHWYVTRPWGEPDQRLNEDYSLENGVLTVKTANKSAWAWSLCTIDARKTSGYGFQHGYLEYSVRLPYTSDDEEKLKNGVRNPGVWAHPTDSVWASVTGVHNERGVEVDWLEYKGTKYQGGAQFHICLHDTLDLKSNDGGHQDHHVAEGKRFFHNDGYAVGGDGKFHVFGCAWSEGILEYYLDGRLIHVKTYAEDGYPDPMGSGVGSDKLGIFYPLEEQYMPVVLGAVTEFRMEVDYVRVWQSDGSVKPEPIYSRLATEFLGIHMTDENGKLIRSVTNQNRARILAAESVWKTLLSEEKAEVQQALGVSYDELLAIAKNGESGTPAPDGSSADGAARPEQENVTNKKSNAVNIVEIIDKTGIPWWVFLLIGGAVLVLAGMAVLIVVLAKRNAKAAQAPSEQPTPTEPSVSEEEQTPPATE